MAIHTSLSSLLLESVPEYLEVAGHCLRRKKVNGGVYGFPAALLLLCITDTIGSYHRGDQSFRVFVDGADCFINGDSAKHFYILNSSYYCQSLSRKQIEKFYDYYRCLLAHNASLPNECSLRLNDVAEPFELGADGLIRAINLNAFYHKSAFAVQQFLSSLASVIPKSKTASIIANKS